VGLNISSLFLKIIKYLSTQHFRYFIPMESIYNHDGFSSFISALKCVSISLCEAQALRCEVSSRSSSRMMQVSRSWASAKIFAGGATLTFRLLFFRLQTIQRKSTITKCFLPFLHHKENTPWKHALRSHFLQSYWGGVVREFAKRLYFFSSFTAFAELGYHPIPLLLWTAENGVWIRLELSTTTFAVLTLVCAG